MKDKELDEKLISLKKEVTEKRDSEKDVNRKRYYRKISQLIDKCLTIKMII